MKGKGILVCLMVCLMVFTATACAGPMYAAASIGPDEGYTGRVDLTSFEEGKVGRKTILGDGARRVVERLAAMQRTGEIEKKICDAQWDDNRQVAEETPEGTMWIKTENDLFRLNLRKETICKVEMHYGEGVLLKADSDFFTWLEGMRFAPYNTDICYYRDGKLETKHCLAAPTTAIVRVKSVKVADPKEPWETESGKKYWVSVTVEVKSLEDQTIWVSLNPVQVGDNMLSGSGEQLELKKGEVKELQLPLFTHYFRWQGGTIWADNTRVLLMNESEQ